MLTKKQYAMAACREWANSHGRDPKDLEGLVGDIYASTNLGIALEILGVVTPQKHSEEYEYLENRAGMITMYVDETIGEPYFLTVREMYDLLPENQE